MGSGAAMVVASGSVTVVVHVGSDSVELVGIGSALVAVAVVEVSVGSVVSVVEAGSDSLNVAVSVGASVLAVTVTISALSAHSHSSEDGHCLRSE